MPIAHDDKGNFLTLDESGQWVPAKTATDPETKKRLVLDGDKWVAPPQGTTTAGAALRGVASGLSFGFADELEAGKNAIVQGARNLFGASGSGPGAGEVYDQTLANERALLDEDSRQHGTASTLGQVGGAIGGAVAGTLLAPQVALPAAAGRIGTAANALWRGMPGAVQTGGRFIGETAANTWGSLPQVVQTGTRLAAGGAAAGGAAGFGEGEGGLGNRASGAGVGALVGAAAGPVLSVAGNFAGGVLNRLGMALGWRSPEKAADRLINRALERGGVTPEELSSRLTAAGDAPVTIMDAGGRPTVNLGATAANTPSTAVQRAEEMVQARRADRPERVVAASDDALGGGSGQDIAEATAQRQAQRRADADPLYTEAFSQPAGMTDNMGHILNDPIGQQGLRRGLEIQRIENNARRARGEEAVPTHDPAIRYNEAGDPEIVGVPNMRSLDAVKRGMDAILEDARDTTTGRITMTERLRAIDDMRRTWVNLLDQGNPAYGRARAAWAGPSEQLESTAAGRRIFSTDRDGVAQRMTNAAPDVQDAYRLGVGRAVADRVSDPATAIGQTRKLLEDSTMQQKMRSVLGSDAELERLNATLRREVEMGNVEHAVNPRAGSQTMRLGEGAKDMGDIPGPWAQAIRLALQGHLGQAAIGGLSDIYRMTAQGVNPRVANALGERLFVTDPARRLEIAAALAQRRRNDLNSIVAAQKWGRPSLRGAAQTAGAVVAGP